MQIRNKSGEVLLDIAGELEGANLRGVKLDDALLEQHSLKRCDLSGAELCLPWLDDSDFTEAIFDGAFIEGGSMMTACFENASMRGIYLYEVLVFRSNFQGADLRGALFRGTNFEGVNFSGANLSGAEFSPDNIGHKTVISCADFRDANLDGTKFIDVVYDSSTKFPDGFLLEDHSLILKNASSS